MIRIVIVKFFFLLWSSTLLSQFAHPDSTQNIPLIESLRFVLSQSSGTNFSIWAPKYIKEKLSPKYTNPRRDIYQKDLPKGKVTAIINTGLPHVSRLQHLLPLVNIDTSKVTFEGVARKQKHEEDFPVLFWENNEEPLFYLDTLINKHNIPEDHHIIYFERIEVFRDACDGFWLGIQYKHNEIDFFDRTVLVPDDRFVFYKYNWYEGNLICLKQVVLEGPSIYQKTNTPYKFTTRQLRDTSFSHLINCF